MYKIAFQLIFAYVLNKLILEKDLHVLKLEYQS